MNLYISLILKTSLVLLSRVYKNFVGTPQFMAPEFLKNESTGRLSDLWSLGCTIYQILAGICCTGGSKCKEGRSVG